MQITFLTKNEELINEVHAFLKEWNNEFSYIKTKTSGSTGRKKTIQIEKNRMVSSAKMTGKFLQLEKNQNALLCLSPKTIGGKMMLVRSIVLNLNLFVSDVCSTPLKSTDSSIHFAAMVPLQVSSSIAKTPKQLKNIQKLIIGGAPVSSSLEKVLNNFPNDVFQTFGMTETISHVAMRKLSEKEISYTALPTISFSQKEDCLIINAPNLGVKNLESNDIIELIDSTHFIWKGRKDFIINSGGIKHSPEELETYLSPILREPFFIAGLADTILGQKIVLIIESEKKKMNKQDFVAVLTKYQLPKEIYFIPHFVRTESDKINRLKTIKKISDAQKQVL